MKKFWALSLAFILSVLMVAGASLPLSAAENCPDLPAEALVTLAYDLDGISYFDVGISNTTSPNIDGNYPGWCIDDDLAANTDTPYYAMLECINDSGLQNPDLINYVLNTSFSGLGAEFIDVQVAIWDLLGETYTAFNPKFVVPSWPDYDQTIVNAIVADAEANGVGFTPGVGELCGVILWPLLSQGGERDLTTQPAMIGLPVPPEDGNEGCTPGFWKGNADNKDASAWTDPYDPEDTFSSVFGRTITIWNGGNPKNLANYTTNPTLREALDANGSGINLLARSAVAALLNAASPYIDYPRDIGDIIADVQDAIDTEDYSLGGLLDIDNNLGCPIDQN